MSSTTDDLWALTAILKAAVGALEELETDQPLMARLVRVFGMMPAEDREPILGVLEREVAYRLEHGQKQGQTPGPDTIRPNPGAALYFRVYDGPVPGTPRPDEVADAMVRATRLVQMVLRMAPDTRLELTDAIGRAFLSIPADVREAADLCVDTVMAIRKRGTAPR